MPESGEVPVPRTNRFVGIFYFTHGRDITELPNDISEILPQDPDILNKPESPLWGPGGPYYSGQPLYGYYDSRDPWVLRRHATLLADAGIDTVIFDTTNRATYPRVQRAICEVWSQVLREGGRAPRLCFMVNTKAGDTAEEIYRELYKPGLSRELWFYWQGKPLLICDPKEARDELQQLRIRSPRSPTICPALWYCPATPRGTQSAHRGTWRSTNSRRPSCSRGPRQDVAAAVMAARTSRPAGGCSGNRTQCGAPQLPRGSRGQPATQHVAHARGEGGPAGANRPRRSRCALG